MNGTVIVILLLVFVMALCLFTALNSPSDVIMDSQGLRISDPRTNARAFAEVQKMINTAAIQQVELKRLQAQIEKEQVEAIAHAQAQDALILRNRLIAVGLGLGTLILCIGLALASVSWLNLRAMTVRPNANGLYPLIIRGFIGGAIVHDANRAISPTTVYMLPGLVEQASKLAGLHLAPSVTAPLAGSEQAQLQITSQAQAITALLAAGVDLKHANQGLAQLTQMIQPGTNVTMPPVRAIEPDETVIRLLEDCS